MYLLMNSAAEHDVSGVPWTACRRPEREIQIARSRI